MEIFYNTSLITLAVLATAGVWGAIGVVILVITGVGANTESGAIIKTVMWPVALASSGVDLVTEWIQKQ